MVTERKITLKAEATCSSSMTRQKHQTLWSHQPRQLLMRQPQGCSRRGSPSDGKHHDQLMQILHELGTNGYRTPQGKDLNLHENLPIRKYNMISLMDHTP